MESDLLTVMQKTRNQTLTYDDVKFSNGSACCVIMASNGYPEKYDTGFEISIPKDIDAEVYAAGAKKVDGKVVTAGGRVLGVTAKADNLKDAIKKAYNATEKISFENAYYRKDIGAKALKALGDK
jgi:phosphoribosylamine--glycine ligase